jgi:hypothetical protein
LTAHTPHAGVLAGLHLRLSKRWIVYLVVAIQAVAHEVNQNALAELLPELGGGFKRVPGQMLQ